MVSYFYCFYWLRYKIISEEALGWALGILGIYA
jgi:hypothetical protein